MKINVLGTEYTIVKGSEGLGDDFDGDCDDTVKRIRIDDFSDCKEKIGIKSDLNVQYKKNLRHEITHAFLFESGLAENSEWAQNEEIVDWIAIQAPKLIAAWLEADAL